MAGACRAPRARAAARLVLTRIGVQRFWSVSEAVRPCVALRCSGEQAMGGPGLSINNGDRPVHAVDLRSTSLFMDDATGGLKWETRMRLLYVQNITAILFADTVF